MINSEYSECPICLENIINPYYLNNCVHKICNKCYRHLDKEDIYPFLVKSVKFSLATCPLCRKKETYEVCYKKYKKEYLQFMEINMNMTPCGMSYYTVERTIEKRYPEPIKKNNKTKINKHR